MSQFVISSNAYKGTRDFYPYESIITNSDSIDLQIYQSYIFYKFKETLLARGFIEYSSSVIESIEPFVKKSGGDLGGKQLYNFTDKGGRDICLRPELTLSVARMIANKFDNLRFPLRWFSIDNCFRYERPQKGRSREFWQAEIDIVGLEAGPSDLELFVVSLKIMESFGAKENSYRVMYNHRLLLEDWIQINNWKDYKVRIYKILDNWLKLDRESNLKLLEEFLSVEDTMKIVMTIEKTGSPWDEYLNLSKKYKELILVNDYITNNNLNENIYLTPVIIRGQEYYTGFIFEIFDNDINNNRSLFGGGRFDNLLDLYGKKIPAVGFAPGDLPVFEFLKNWKLLDNYENFEVWKIVNYPHKVGIVLSTENKVFQLFNDLIPNLVSQNKTFDIDYDYERNTKKRRENLMKRGCKEIIEL
jgi:histidyl-tRNA synthetase